MARNGMRLSIKDSGAIRIARNIRLELSVGVHPEDGDIRHDGSDLTVGQIAEIHEFGNSAVNIPARKWVRGWFAQYRREVEHRLTDALRRMTLMQRFRGEPLKEIADYMTETMQGRILGGKIKPKNTASTLERKAPELRALVESHQFVTSIQSKVKWKTLPFGLGAKEYKTSDAGDL